MRVRFKMSQGMKHNEPERVRRKLGDAYAMEAKSKRWTKGEREAFAAMAESWERTIKKK